MLRVFIFESPRLWVCSVRLRLVKLAFVFLWFFACRTLRALGGLILAFAPRTSLAAGSVRPGLVASLKIVPSCVFEAAGVLGASSPMVIGLSGACGDASYVGEVPELAAPGWPC